MPAKLVTVCAERSAEEARTANSAIPAAFRQAGFIGSARDKDFTAGEFEPGKGSTRFLQGVERKVLRQNAPCKKLHFREGKREGWSVRSAGSGIVCAQSSDRGSAMTQVKSNQLTPQQQFLNDLWEEHIRDEFATKDTAATLDTMVPNAYVNHIPVLTGGVGREQLREFYSKHFIPKMPPDTEIVPVSRTIGSERLVDEMVFRFTHTIEMDWMLPGVAPTGKRVECALVVIVHFRDGKLAHEHIYWDQASVLVQLGLLDPAKLPVAGRETALKLADPTVPSNELIRRAQSIPGL